MDIKQQRYSHVQQKNPLISTQLCDRCLGLFFVFDDWWLRCLYYSCSVKDLDNWRFYSSFFRVIDIIYRPSYISPRWMKDTDLPLMSDGFLVVIIVMTVFEW